MSSKLSSAALALLLLAPAARAAKIPEAADQSVEEIAGRNGSFLVPAEYMDAGESLQHGVLPDGTPLSRRLPFATLLAIHIYNGSAHNPLGARFWRAACVGLEVLLVFTLGSLLQPFAGALSLLLISRATPADGNQLVYSLLLLLVAGALASRARKITHLRSGLVGVAVGATLLFRSPLALFPPAFAAFEWALDFRRPRRPYLKHFLLLVLVPYAFLIPWARMNWIVHREFIPLEKGAAVSNIVTGALGLVQCIEGDLSTVVGPGVAMGSASTALRWAIRVIARDPGAYLASCAARVEFVFFLHPWLFAFALLAFALHRRRREYRDLAFLAAYFILIHCLMSVQERYFTPLWPLLVPLAVSLPFPALLARATDADGALYAFSERVLKGSIAAAAALSLCVLWTVQCYARQARRGALSSVQAWDAAIAESPREGWLLFQRGRVRLRAGALPGAIEDFRSARDLNPGRAEYGLQLAWAEALNGDPRDLLAWTPPAREDVEDPFSVVEAGVYQAAFLEKAGRPAAARASLKAAMDVDDSLMMTVRGEAHAPETLVLRKLRSSSSFMLKLPLLLAPLPPVQRLAVVQEVLRVSPARSGALAAQADLALLVDDRPLCRRSQLAAEKLAPGGAESREIAARCFWWNSRREPWIDDARAAVQAGDRPAARKILDDAEPGTSDAGRRRIADFDLQLGDAPRAVTILKRLLETSPADPALAIDLALAALRTGDRTLARNSLTAAEALAPGDDERHRAALAWQELKEYGRAAAILDGLVLRHPRKAAYFSDRGLCRYLGGARAAAIADLKRALRLDPGLMPAYLTLGSVYVQEKRDDDAVALYDKALARGEAAADPRLRALLVESRDALRAAAPKRPSRVRADALDEFRKGAPKSG
jgi:tetratricopeptide (TPR) repeat protein